MERDYSYKLMLTKGEYNELKKQAELLGVTRAVLIRSALATFYKDPQQELVGAREEVV